MKHLTSKKIILAAALLGLALIGWFWVKPIPQKSNSFKPEKPEQDTGRVAVMIGKGDLYANRGRFDSAIMMYSSAMQNCTGPEKSKEALCLNKIAEILILAGAFDQAKALTQKALQESVILENVKETGGAYLNLGSVFAMNGHWDSAMAYYRRTESIWIKNNLHAKSFMGENYLNIATVFGENEELDSAFHYAYKAFSIFEKSVGDSSQVLSYCYNTLGTLYQKSGDFPKAIACFDKAIALWVPRYGNGHPIVASLYANIGELYRESGNGMQAIAYLNKAELLVLQSQGPASPMLASIYHNQAGANIWIKEYPAAQSLLKKALAQWPFAGYQPARIATTLNNLGYLYFQEKEFDSASYFYEEGIKTAGKIGNNNQILLDLYSNVGNLLISLRQFQAARDTLEFTIRNYEQRKILKNPHLARLYFNLSRLEYIENKPFCAMSRLQKSIICNMPGFNDTNFRHNPPLTDIIDKSVLLYSLNGKVETYLALYYRNPDSVSWLLGAFETAELAAQLADSIRIEKSLEDSQWLIQKELLPYPYAIELAYILYHRTGDRLYLEKAFELSEKSKYNSLVKSNQELEARNIGGVPLPLQEFARSIQSKLIHYRNSLRETESSEVPDPVKIKYYKQQVFMLNHQSDSLKKSLEKNYPDYYRLKYNTKIASLEEVQKKLDDQEALVEYSLTYNYLVTFAITRNTVTMTGKLVARKVAPLVAELRQIIKDKRAGEQEVARYVAVAGSLHSILLDGILPMVRGKRLTIIPDGVIGSVPFESLPDPRKVKTGDNSFDKLPYFVYTNTVGYGYSATLYLNSLKMKEYATGKDRILGFAPSFPLDSTGSYPTGVNRSVGFGALPFSKKEVEDIHKNYGGNAYIGSVATKTTFLRESPGYGILHLATHGLVNDKRPTQSMLVFYQKQLAGDSNLYLWELYNLKLKANIVILSACNTGYGAINNGEGIMSISYGFAFSGVSSMISSLWEVHDQSTCQIMNNFYKHLFDQETKPGALQKAQIDFLSESDPNLSHPYYWAGFIPIGNSDPLPIHNRLVLFFCIALAIIIIVSNIVYIRGARSL